MTNDLVSLCASLLEKDFDQTIGLTGKLNFASVYIIEENGEEDESSKKLQKLTSSTQSGLLMTQRKRWGRVEWGECTFQGGLYMCDLALSFKILDWIGLEEKEREENKSEIKEKEKVKGKLIFLLQLDK